MSGRAPEKASLVADNGDRIDCTFNPTDITITKSATWKRSNSRGSEEPAPPEFTGTKPRALKLQLFFDGWDSGTGDISADIDMLFRWTSPTPDSIDINMPQPPLIVMHWGSSSYFECYVKQVSAKYTMFHADGHPLRAKVTCTFEETPQSADGQNPTSGGVSGNRTHTLIQGETLQSVAYREYRKPDRWRAIAIANNIDDPFRIRPGDVLLIPPASDAALLSAIGGGS